MLRTAQVPPVPRCPHHCITLITPPSLSPLSGLRRLELRPGARKHRNRVKMAPECPAYTPQTIRGTQAVDSLDRMHKMMKIILITISSYKIP